jgi:hypothetical protein
MAGDDQPIDNARSSSRPVPQDFCGPDWIHLDNPGVEERLKPVQRRRLRNIVMMLKGMERLGDHEIGHDHPLPSDQRALDPASSNFRLGAWFADEQPKHDRGVKPDGHWPIPWQYLYECRSTDAIFPWRTGEGNPPKTSRDLDP